MDAKRFLSAFLFSFSILVGTLCSQEVPTLQFDSLFSADQPVDLASPADSSNRLFVVEKLGRIRIYYQNLDSLQDEPFFDISEKVAQGSEQGLLGLAFHPRFDSLGYFYVNYTDTLGDTFISRFTVSSLNKDSADQSTELILMRIDQPYPNHNGGDLAFGDDGYLYIPLGDGGNAGDPENRAQNPTTLLGKILRINVDSADAFHNYSIPLDNPFAGVQSPVDTLDEIWAIGLRNPWRISFDRDSNDLWIADVGQNSWEELNFQAYDTTANAGGENYGWRCFEGRHVFEDTLCGADSIYTFPIFEYPHDSLTGGFTVIGGYVYRGVNSPALRGWYVMADYIVPRFWLIHMDSTKQIDMFAVQDTLVLSYVSTFGEDEYGELYAATLPPSGDGIIYRVVGVGQAPLPLELVRWRGWQENRQVQLGWTTASEVDVSHFVVEKSGTEKAFHDLGTVPALGTKNGQRNYQFTDPSPTPGDNFYRLKMVDVDGKFSHSNIINVKLDDPAAW
ncbi:MAG: PQQ-dependent sugar dehydrogenase, partial [Bacteroidota bacterium]